MRFYFSPPLSNNENLIEKVRCHRSQKGTYRILAVHETYRKDVIKTDVRSDHHFSLQ